MDISVKPAFREKIERGFWDIPYFVREILEEEIHEEQEACLRQMRGKQEVAITCGNRWGKGDLIKLFGAWIAAYKPVPEKFKDKKIPILNTSISQDQANIVFDKFIDTLVDKRYFKFFIKTYKKSPFPHIIFRNNVVWWFRNASQNGKYLEGRNYFWSNFDEADLQDNFPEFIEDILEPRLWDFGGPLTWTTTPRRGKKNAYRRAKKIEKWNKTVRNDYETSKIWYCGDSRKNHFLHPSAIDKMNDLPRRLFNKNVLGLFEDSEGEIAGEVLDQCSLIADGLQDHPQDRRVYINAWDLARSSTYLCGVTIEVGNPLQVRSWERWQEDKNNRDRKYWQNVAERVRARNAKWPGRTAIDATGLGDVVGSFIEDINPECVKLVGEVRQDIIETGITTLEQGGIGIPLKDITQVLNGESWRAEDELADFDQSALDKTIWDWVCALFIGIWVAKGRGDKYIKRRGLGTGKKRRNVQRNGTSIVKGADRNEMARE